MHHDFMKVVWWILLLNLGGEVLLFRFAATFLSSTLFSFSSVFIV